MQADPVVVYQDLKFWIPMITASGLFLKTALWLRNLATKEDLHAQTTAIVNSIEGMRQDIRTTLTPPPRLARARSSKKKIDTVFEHHV